MNSAEEGVEETDIERERERPNNKMEGWGKRGHLLPVCKTEAHVFLYILIYQRARRVTVDQ